MDFEQFWNLMKPDPVFANRYAATEREWNKLTVQKQQAIMDWLRKHGSYAHRNPYFFIVDFHMPAQEPTNYNGRKLKDGVEYISAKYKGQWGMYTAEDVKQFNLETR